MGLLDVDREAEQGCYNNHRSQEKNGTDGEAMSIEECESRAVESVFD